MSLGLSETLAKFIRGMSYEDLSDEVIEFTKLCILDWAGSALAGKSEPPVQMMREMVQEMGGTCQASLVTGGQSSALHAALVNGAASHVVEMDDIHRTSIIHAGTVVIPAALSIAEWKRMSGKDLITAIVLGYEVCYRIGEAVSPSHYTFWHSTATCGTFGAAAATAKLLNLQENQIIDALGSAGTQAAGLWEFIVDGAMSKQLHPAKSAMNGVLAALLAEKGFTAAHKILEGDRGFFQAMSEDYDSTAVTGGLGSTFKILENSFKVHASCRHTHPAIDLMLDVIQERKIKSEDIAHILVQTYQVALNITDNPHPETVYAAKFSLQYCTAHALVTGKAGMADFTDDSLRDPEIRDLMKKVTINVDDNIDSLYPEKWAARVEIKLMNGEIIRKQTDYPKGDPENPASVDELVDKFRSLAASSLPEERQERYIERVMNLEKEENVAPFFD